MTESNWVGGDISGLHGMAQSLAAVPAETHNTVTTLSSKVQTLTGDAGWQGDAATQFAQKWSADSVTGGALAEAIKAVGDALGELASTLLRLDPKHYEKMVLQQTTRLAISCQRRSTRCSRPA